MDLSVVVPVHNEAENIAPLTEEIAAALGDRWRYEIIYVDDGSTDDTLAILKAVRLEWPTLRVLHHTRARGQSTAVHSGVRAAHGRLIATLDGDGQNDPADLPGLIEAFEIPDTPDGLQLVIGHRRQRRDNFAKRVSSRIANGVRRALLRDDTPDTGCGIKVFPRTVFLDLPYFDHMHRFLPALVLRQGGQVRSVPVNHRPRRSGASKYGIWNRLWVGIVDILGVAWLRRREKRSTHIEELSSAGQSDITHP